MKLELKYLAPYLPYGLRAINLHGKEVEIIGLSNGNDSVSNHLWVFRENDKTGRHFQGYLYECKPLLHPLSRLTEPILEGGKIPLHELLRSNCFNVEKIMEEQGVEELNKYEPAFQPPFIDFADGLKLCEWHFDVFGLIEKGLAEQIETPKANGE